MLKYFVKKLFGLLFMAICYFSVDLGHKLPKKSGSTGRNRSEFSGLDLTGKTQNLRRLTGRSTVFFEGLCSVLSKPNDKL